MNPPRSSSRRLQTLAMVLAGAAIVCRLAFHALGSRVDAAGVLREPFALLPITTLLLRGGCGPAALKLGRHQEQVGASRAHHQGREPRWASGLLC